VRRSFVNAHNRVQRILEPTEPPADKVREEPTYRADLQGADGGVDWSVKLYASVTGTRKPVKSASQLQLATYMVFPRQGKPGPMSVTESF
jgi:hypothetical protein